MSHPKQACVREEDELQKFSFKKPFCTYFIHVVLNIDECWPNVAHGKFCAHTDCKKLEGTLTASTTVLLIVSYF